MDDGLNNSEHESGRAVIDCWGENGDFLVSYLMLLGVEYVFGVPGGAIEPLVNALARAEAEGGPKCVMARHETGAAFMAEGYHSTSGKLGVCFATTGPGATNLVTGVASAYVTKTPMLVITAQTSLESFGRGALQESSCTGINTLAIFDSITRYNSLVSHPDQLEYKLAAAVMAAMRGPRGPVHLSIPIDVLKAAAKQPPAFTNLAMLVQRPRLFDALAFEQFYTILLNSTKAVFVIGGEAGDALSALVEIAEGLNISLVETPHGKGLVNPYHPLYRGVVGFSGHVSAEDALKDPAVDLVIAVGASLGEWASNGWDGEVLLNNRLVHLAASEQMFAASPMARLHLWGNIESVLREVLRRLATTPHPRQVEAGGVRELTPLDDFHFSLKDVDAFQSDQSPILPQRLMAELPRLFPGDTRYLADSGNSLAWAMHYLHLRPLDGAARSGETSSAFKASLDFAPMGWAIGNAIGVALAEPGRPVVCITGDGSYLMSGQEITVAIQQRVPVIFLILNDSAYGMVKHGQMLTGAERVGFSLPTINFADVARAMGVPGYVIHSVEDLQALDIDAICTAEGPTLLDVRINGDVMPPIGLRVKVLKGAQ